MKAIFLLIFSFLLLNAHAQESAEQKIRAVMDQQIEAWNKGDLLAFMDTYWKNDSLIFVGKNGVVYGWRQTLERYQKSYPSKGAMGKLAFTILKVQPLGTGFYNVVGKWHLSRQGGDLEGHYTLVFKDIMGSWKIIQDHSS